MPLDRHGNPIEEESEDPYGYDEYYSSEEASDEEEEEEEDETEEETEEEEEEVDAALEEGLGEIVDKLEDEEANLEDLERLVEEKLKLGLVQVEEDFEAQAEKAAEEEEGEVRSIGLVSLVSSSSYLQQTSFLSDLAHECMYLSHIIIHILFPHAE